MLDTFNRALELSDRTETEYLRILYYDFSRKYSGTYKSYEYPRLCTILDGEKEITIDDKASFTYDNDQFLLMPPSSQVHMNIDRPTTALVFELSDILIEKVAKHSEEDGPIDYQTFVDDRLLCAKDNRQIKDILNKITVMLANPKKSNKYLLDLHAQELVYNLIQVKGVPQMLDLEFDNPVNKAIKYMNEEYMNPITIGEIAYQLNMSEANFSQYFKKVTGITPKAYLTNIKLEKARQMIVSKNVTEVAYDLGYENVSHFIGLFRDKYGLTPKQYKNKIIPQK
ncbi:MAG: helix-turn-helix domain-containing protein [Clostridia bacterium]|nr:helix-turn-helix domain-containing protein [Clostridia bacterium]